MRSRWQELRKVAERLFRVGEVLKHVQQEAHVGLRVSKRFRPVTKMHCDIGEIATANGRMAHGFWIVINGEDLPSLLGCDFHGPPSSASEVNDGVVWLDRGLNHRTHVGP